MGIMYSLFVAVAYTPMAFCALAAELAAAEAALAEDEWCRLPSTPPRTAAIIINKATGTPILIHLLTPFLEVGPPAMKPVDSNLLGSALCVEPYGEPWLYGEFPLLSTAL